VAGNMKTFNFHNCIITDTPDKITFEVQKGKYIDMDSNGKLVLCSLLRKIEAEDRNYTVSISVREGAIR